MNFTCKSILTALVLAAALCQANECTSAPSFFDNKTPHTTIVLQDGEDLTFSTDWAQDGASVTIMAEGQTGTASEGILDYTVFSTEDQGSGDFYWNYSAIPGAELPKDSYELVHNIYDSDHNLIDSVSCNVKLLPEPCSLGALALLLAALVRKSF